MMGLGGWHEFWMSMAAHLWLAGLVIVALAAIDRWLLRAAPARYPSLLWTLGLVALCLPATLVGGALAKLVGRWGGEAAVLEVVATQGAWRTVLRPELLSATPAMDGAVWPWASATVVWLAGAAALAIVGIRSGRAAAVAVTTVEPVMGKRLAAAATRAGVPTEQLVVTERLCMPHARGIARPRIVLCSALLAALDVEELATVIRHERAHLQRRDPLRRLCYSGALLVFWFFPLTWLVMRRLHRATELACDEAVIRAGFDPAVYARAIARTLRVGAAWAPAPGAALARPRGAELRLRLEAIRSANRETSMKRVVLALGLAGGVVVAAIFAAVTPAGAQDAQTGGRITVRPSGSFERLLGLRGVGREIDLDARGTPRDLLLLLARQGGFSVRFVQAEDTAGTVAARDEMMIDLKMTNTTVGVALVHLARTSGLAYTVASSRELVVNLDARSTEAEERERRATVEALQQADSTGGRLSRRGRDTSDRRPIPAHGPLAIGGDVRAPERTHFVAPEYPEAARAARVGGVVILEIRLDREGRVAEATVLRGLGMGLDEASLAAVRQWRYAPTVHEGRPVEVLLTVTTQFTLMD